MRGFCKKLVIAAVLARQQDPRLARHLMDILRREHETFTSRLRARLLMTWRRNTFPLPLIRPASSFCILG